MNIRKKAIFQKQKAFCLDKERYLKLFIEMIWHYNLRILSKEVCKFPSSLTLAREKDSQNMLQRLVYEEKYKLKYYAVLNSLAYEGLFNCPFFIKLWFRSNKFALLQFCLMFLQFKGIAFISCIQEKYKLSASLNSVFNTFHNFKFPKQSSKLFR